MATWDAEGSRESFGAGETRHRETTPATGLEFYTKICLYATCLWILVRDFSSVLMNWYMHCEMRKLWFFRPEVNVLRLRLIKSYLYLTNILIDNLFSISYFLKKEFHYFLMVKYCACLASACMLMTKTVTLSKAVLFCSGWLVEGCESLDGRCQEEKGDGDDRRTTVLGGNWVRGAGKKGSHRKREETDADGARSKAWRLHAIRFALWGGQRNVGSGKFDAAVQEKNWTLIECGCFVSTKESFLCLVELKSFDRLIFSPSVYIMKNSNGWAQGYILIKSRPGLVYVADVLERFHVLPISECSSIRTVGIATSSQTENFKVVFFI